MDLVTLSSFYNLSESLWKTKSLFFSLFVLAGNELLYRNREGDVIKFNVDIDEKTVLVHNKKFVSLIIFSFLLSQSKDLRSDHGCPWI